MQIGELINLEKKELEEGMEIEFVKNSFYPTTKDYANQLGYPDAVFSREEYSVFNSDQQIKKGMLGKILKIGEVSVYDVWNGEFRYNLKLCVVELNPEFLNGRKILTTPENIQPLSAYKLKTQK